MKQYSEQCVISKGYVMSGRSLSVVRHQISFLFLVAISVHWYDHCSATCLPTRCITCRCKLVIKLCTCRNTTDSGNIDFSG